MTKSCFSMTSHQSCAQSCFQFCDPTWPPSWIVLRLVHTTWFRLLAIFVDHHLTHDLLEIGCNLRDYVPCWYSFLGNFLPVHKCDSGLNFFGYSRNTSWRESGESKFSPISPVAQVQLLSCSNLLLVKIWICVIISIILLWQTLVSCLVTAKTFSLLLCLSASKVSYSLCVLWQTLMSCLVMAKTFSLLLCISASKVSHNLCVFSYFNQHLKKELKKRRTKIMCIETLVQLQGRQSVIFSYFECQTSE